MKKQTSKNKLISYNKRALSPIFATLILVTIVIVFGATAYYYTSNLTTTATNSYVGSITDSQQTISERVGFESVYFISSDDSNPPGVSPTLTVYIINCGSASNLKVNAILLKIYDSSDNLLSTQPYNIEPGIKSGAQVQSGMKNLNQNALGVGEEGYFVVKLPSGTSLTTGLYTIQLITKSGSSFEYTP